MKLSEIQTNLQTVIAGLALFAAVPDCVLIDDGMENEPMETALKDKGLAILIFDPQATLIDDSSRGAVKLGYSTTVWLRTNPKAALAWSLFECEEAILTAVMQWSRARSDFGFVIPKGLEPETDWADTGAHSRLIRFQTGVHFH